MILNLNPKFEFKFYSEFIQLKEIRGSKRLKRNFIAKVVAGRRITIPQEICQVLEIKEGHFVDVDVEKIKANSKEGN